MNVFKEPSRLAIERDRAGGFLIEGENIGVVYEIYDKGIVIFGGKAGALSIYFSTIDELCRELKSLKECYGEGR